MSIETKVRVLTSPQVLDPVPNEVINFQSGSTGISSLTAPVNIGSFPTVEVESTGWITQKTMSIDWTIGATMYQRETFNLLGPTGDSSYSLVQSPLYQSITGPTGSLSDYRVKVSYGATSQDTPMVIKVTNPGSMYSEQPNLKLYSSENPSGPYTLEYSRYFLTPGEETDTISFPSSHYMRIDFEYQDIPEATNQVSFSVYSDLYLVQGVTFAPNNQGATAQVYNEEIYESIPFKSGAFDYGDMTSPEAAVYYYDITFSDPFPTTDYAINVIGLGPDGMIHSGRDRHSGKYDPFILNKATGGFRYQVDDGTHGLTGFNFMWSTVYNGENTTAFSSEVVSDGTKSIVTKEPIRYLYVNGSENVYYLDILTQTI
jgi:hypothetical protein